MLIERTLFTRFNMDGYRIATVSRVRTCYRHGTAYSQQTRRVQTVRPGRVQPRCATIIGQVTTALLKRWENTENSLLYELIPSWPSDDSAEGVQQRDTADPYGNQ